MLAKRSFKLCSYSTIAYNTENNKIEDCSHLTFEDITHYPNYKDFPYCLSSFGITYEVTILNEEKIFPK